MLRRRSNSGQRGEDMGTLCSLRGVDGGDGIWQLLNGFNTITRA
jgi:hypothetical protein